MKRNLSESIAGATYPTRRLSAGSTRRSLALILSFGIALTACSRENPPDTSATQTTHPPSTKAVEQPQDFVLENHPDFQQYRKAVLSRSLSLIESSLRNSAPSRIIPNSVIEKAIDDHLSSFRSSTFSSYYDQYIEMIKADLVNYLEGRYKEERLDPNQVGGLEISRYGHLADALREFFSDPLRLELFYEENKSYATRHLENGIKDDEEKAALVSYLNQGADSLAKALDTGFRGELEGYLQVEAQYLKAVELTRKNSLKAELKKKEQELHRSTPDLKISKFAFRRYLEGGPPLVHTYEKILRDLARALEESSESESEGD